jgi:branched-chain amino acid transport system permease protein
MQSDAHGLGLAWGAAPADRCASTAETVMHCSTFPATRFFMMVVALVMLLSLWLLLTRTRIGLVIQAALTHPEAVEALGHNVPRVFMLVFGSGCGLAALAGVIGGVTFVTEPSMATIVGSIIFVVVVVGGMGSLAGAFVASLLIGLMQTLPLTVDKSLVHLAGNLGWAVAPGDLAYPLMKITLAQAAPILPYLLLVLILIFRPKGLLGTREG